jgi:hydroxybutyrate-dimer hydrolase
MVTKTAVRYHVPALLLTCSLTLAAGPSAAGIGEERPDFLRGAILHRHTDGIADDLLTAGLGRTGLANPTPPGFADSLSPTAAELRRRAIYTNYRALVDMSPGGGYGTLYGPNVTADGTVTGGEGLIAGDEYLALAREDDQEDGTVLMVQVPDSFDPANACIVTAPSSGSRGIYGAIATAGEWGLKNGCAVAYTDKGTGIGAHDLQGDRVDLITGAFVDADDAGRLAQFDADLSAARLAAFNATMPNRYAFKHAHSGENPERNWGRDVLRSIEFAFYILNRRFGSEAEPLPITPDGTIVIGSSVSNGGGASLHAAEQDRHGLIDGVAVSEPNVEPRYDSRFTIVQEGRDPVVRHSRPLLEYTTLVNVFQACASLDPALAGLAPLNLSGSAARCQALADLDLIEGATTAEQAVAAQAVINDFGILPEQNVVQPSHHFLYVPQSISVTYANSYGRFGVERSLCGYSFGATDAAGMPIPLADASAEVLFATANGIPPTGGVNLINDDAPGGPREDRLSTPDQNLAGALCLRSLASGRDAVTGDLLTGQPWVQSARVRTGIREVRVTGDLDGLPVVMIHGRSDAILPPNHTSRAYYGLALAQPGARHLRYYEITNAQHLDTLNALPGFGDRFIPLHVYFFQALDLMYDHLRTGAPLPPSQVVHTVPRGPGAPPIGPANLPPIDATPASDDLIRFSLSAGRLFVPE